MKEGAWCKQNTKKIKIRGNVNYYLMILTQS